MAKNKLAKFNEMEGFKHVFQPGFREVYKIDYHLKGKWNTDVFKNEYPIVLELGCGKAEYTIGLAEKYPERNFIGIDIKGARIWRGAKLAKEKKLINICFIRSRIDFVDSLFDKNEIEEIWLTFSDPQPKKLKKRLSSSLFLNKYMKFLKPNAIIHLKTDNFMLYWYTKAVIEINKLKINFDTDDVYNAENLPYEVTEIQTFYEKQFLEDNKKINYLEFHLNNIKPIVEPKKFNAKFANKNNN